MLSFDTKVCGQHRWSIYSRQARNTKKAIFVQQIIQEGELGNIKYSQTLRHQNPP